MARTRTWWLAACLACAAAADTPPGIRLELGSGSITVPGVSVAGLETRLAWPGGHLEVGIAMLQFGDRTPFSNIRLSCPEFTLDPGTFALGCEGGKLSFDHPLASPRDMPVRLDWHPDKGGDLQLTGVPVAGDALSARVRRDREAWTVEVETAGTDLAAVAGLLPAAGLELGGRADVRARIDISDQALQRIDLIVEHEATRFRNSEATLLGEGLTGRVNLALEKAGDLWQGSLDGRWQQGEMLTPAAYVEATRASPVTVAARLAADPHGTRVDLERLRVTQPPWIRLDGRAALDLGSPPGLRRLEARVADTDAGAVYARYLKPVVIHPVLAALELSGTAAGRILVENGSVARLQLELADAGVAADTEQVRFAVEGIASKVEFGRGTEQKGYLGWRAATLAGFDVGATRIPVSFAPRSLATSAPVTVPVMDGGLEIERFAVDWTRTPPDITFDALLLPVSMEKVTHALGWVPMQGQLSGVLPRVAVSEGGLQVGGNLLVRVFDGTVVIRNLRVSDMFGYWPVLTADADCRELDLEMLTGTYEFGRITGRIDGSVAGLRLENWRPTAFDARFGTTPGDRTPHRISQRAVDNISSLSGGASGAVSRTFLRFFDEFNYDRLGITCRLRNGICQMDGVEPAKTGYYLVKGGGIPRIDVIGFNRSTDWDQLVDRLIAITESGPPIIE